MNKFFEKLKTLLHWSVPAVVLVFLLLLGMRPAFSNWASFRGNPQLTGVAASQLPEKLELLWTFKAGDMIESTATIVDGTVYMGASDGYLYAIDAQSGKSTWKYHADASIKSSPSIYNNVIYFGDEEGIFHAVDIATQKKKWQYTTDGEIISSANFAGDRVLFGSYDGFLYCLNIKNGDLIWKFETEGYVHGTPAIFGNFVIVTGCDSYLRIINIADGTQTQQVNLGAYVGASPAILDSNSQTDPEVRAYCGTYGNEVLGVDLTSGEIAWRYEHPVRKLPFFASAAVTERLVIIGGRDKMVHALSPEKGEPQWTYTAKSRIESSPVIVGKRVFFGTTRGGLIALDITNGNQVWKFETGSSIVASPSVANGRIYIGTEDGVLYCFGEKK
ncbi:serine/threonine protein kinase [Candidatus Poribacteria bacterium]|nr:MAG: serine/threonine protein kinase [Candidatus Poribacteria bacterium]